MAVGKLELAHDAHHLAAEAHVETFVELVDDEQADAVAFNGAVFQIEIDSAWCCKNDLRLELFVDAKVLRCSVSADETL